MATRASFGSRIPFLLVRIPKPERPASEIEDRLVGHLRKLRATTGGVPGDDSASTKFSPISAHDWEKVHRRIRRLSEARRAAHPLSWLKGDERKRIEGVRDGVRLVSLPSEHAADELAAALHDEFPWLAPATEIVWHSMRRSVREGLPGVRIPPLLLDGPPGIGKSVWARHLSRLLGTPATFIEATNESASFGVVGSQRTWSSAAPGRVIELMLREKAGNPLVVVDEIEKAGSARSSDGRSYDLCAALLPLLEPATAARWTCPYYGMPVDMSHIIWVLTTNDANLLTQPFLSRCPPIHLRNLTPSELSAFVQRDGARRGLSEAAISTLVTVIESLSTRTITPSLRTVIRMLERAADLDSRPMLH